MSVEDRLISVYQLPKVRLTAAPRHVYSGQSQTEDSGYKPSSSDQFWQRRQPQNKKQAKNALHMLQTQECSRKFSSAFLSSQTSQPGHVKASNSTTVAVKGSGHHIRPARSHTTEDRKIRTVSASASTTPSCGGSSCYVDGPLAHYQRSGNMMLQSNTFMIPSTGTTRNTVEQPEKDSDRPSANSAWARSTWKAKVDDNQQSTFSKVSDSYNDAGIKQYHYSNASHDNINNSNCLHRSDFARLQLIDHASYSPSSQQNVEAGSNASPSYCGDSKRHISVTLLMQNGNVKRSQFALTAAKHEECSHVAPGVLVTASDNADNRSISRSVSPELQTLQPDNAAVILTQKSENDDSYTQDPLSHSCAEAANIKIEKRLISNKPMTICTLPVPKPAFVCKPLLPETAASIRPNFSYPTSVSRSYHETTRSQRHESLPLTESSHSIEWPLRSAAISRLPYVGADLWELTMQRLQSAVIDKISQKAENEQKSNASEPVTGYEVNSPTASSMSSDFALQSGKEQSQSAVGRYVKKCLSAKVVHPETKLSVRGSQSTGHLQQNFSEDDEDEAVVDCDTEM